MLLVYKDLNYVQVIFNKSLYLFCFACFVLFVCLRDDFWFCFVVVVVVAVVVCLFWLLLLFCFYFHYCFVLRCFVFTHMNVTEKKEQ